MRTSYLAAPLSRVQQYSAFASLQSITRSRFSHNTKMAPQRIVVVGAGVAGLTCARMLSEAGYSVTVVAKHMPGDYDVDYASPWAGANYLP